MEAVILIGLMNNHLLTWCGSILLFGVWLCGLSFDQLRMFNLEDYPAHDGYSYISMSHGNYNVPPNHRYRVLIPSAVRLLGMGLPTGVASSSEADKAFFYLVNLSLGALMLSVCLRFLLANGVRFVAALIVTLMLGGSRFILQGVAQPLIDMGLYLALALLVYFISTRQWTALCLWMPLMALSKEPIYPLLLLPVFFIPKEKRLWLVASYVVSLLGIAWVRHSISAVAPVGYVSPLDPSWSLSSNSIWRGLVELNFPAMIPNMTYLFTVRGGFDIVIAFGALWIWVLAALAWRCRDIPRWLYIFLPYALWCGLLSRHWGRMLTIAFPWVILYAARGFECVISRISFEHRAELARSSNRP